MNICAKEDLKNIDKSNDEININLLETDSIEYSKNQLEILNYLANNPTILNNANKPVNIVIADEKIPYKIFCDICKLHNNIYSGNKMNLLVIHRTRGKTNYSETKLWDIETIIKANSYIYKICNEIKSKNLSPAEAYTYIYLKVSTLTKYSCSKNRSGFSNDQLFAGAFLKEPEFVCAGFTSLVNEIIDTLNMPGLKSTRIACTVRNLENDNTEDHSRLKIEIYDDKYSIDGHFYSDPTWDNVRGDFNIPKYCHMLMAVNCQDDDMSKYDFYDFDEIKKDNDGRQYYKRYYPMYEYMNEPDTPILQQKLEKLIFATMSKTTSKSFDKLYNMLEKMANDSYNAQQIEKFKGSLNSNKLALTKDEAKKIYDKNRMESEEENIF